MKIVLTRKLRFVCLFLLAVVAANFIRNSIELNNTEAPIPPALPGDFVVFEGEMGKASLISQIDTTEEYIYIAYSNPGIVAVYNWEGEYQYSLAFYSDTNGALRMRCEDGLVYVCDYASYEIVLSGTEQHALFAPSEKPHRVRWFHEQKEIPLVFKMGNLFDIDGNFIMTLPGHF